MVWMILFLILVCGFCDSQKLSNSCNGREHCKGVTNCIGDYNDLEIYIINNTKMVEALAKTFFTTRRTVSKFVKITYNFQTNKGIQSVKDGIINCSSQQDTYVWSETALYLLGPKALYWFTLTAIRIGEVDVTVDSPCLCNDVYTSLLSRLTYLIKVYAATKYHDHPLQFVNKNYFQVKSTTNDESYQTIMIIMIFMTILPLTLMFGVSPLTVLHIYPMVLRRIDIKKVKVYPRDYLDSGILIIKPKNLIESYYKKMLHMKPLILTAAVICIGFWTIHVLSVMAFIQYGNEVLNSENYHYIIPIAHAVLSLLAVATGFVLTVIFLKVRISKYKQQQQQQQQEGSNDVLYDQSLLIPAAAISVNFIYIGCFFLPYMLLAFVHDPLLTTFTYLTLVLFIVCIYLLCLGICHLYKFYNNKKDTYNKDIKRAKFLDSILYSCMVWALAFSLMMFLVIVTYIISLGSFNDFKDLKYLISSLPLVVVLFLLRPAITLVSNKNEEASNDNDDRRMEEGQRAENNDDQTHPDTTENSDSDSQTQVLTDNN